MLNPTTKPLPARIPLQQARRWAAKDEDPAECVVQVFCTQPAYQQAWEHAHSDLLREVGGWLVGRWCWDEKQLEEFVVVEAVLPAGEVEHSSTYLTFTQNSQVAMLDQLEEQHPDKCVVGWYHTHPRLGLFLSGYDLWLHEHFFPHSWQVALVMDPHAQAGGFFIRDRQLDLDPVRYYGFYELRRPEEASTVNWSNLHLLTPEPQSAEEDVNQ